MEWGFQSLKIPISIYSLFFPKSAALGIEAETGLGLAQRIRNPKLDSWGDFGAGGEGAETKTPFLESNKNGIEGWCKTLRILGMLRQRGGNTSDGNISGGNTSGGIINFGNTGASSSGSSPEMVFGGTDPARAASAFAQRSRLQGKRENPTKQGWRGWKHPGKQRTGRSGKADALREGRDVSQRIPAWHSPTRTWLSPVAVPLPAAAPPPRWALGSKHGKKGKILKGRNFKKKFCIPLPSLMTQRKMSNGSEQGSECQRGLIGFTRAECHRSRALCCSWRWIHGQAGLDGTIPKLPAPPSPWTGSLWTPPCPGYSSSRAQGRGTHSLTFIIFPGSKFSSFGIFSPTVVALSASTPSEIRDPPPTPMWEHKAQLQSEQGGGGGIPNPFGEGSSFPPSHGGATGAAATPRDTGDVPGADQDPGCGA